MMYMHINFQQNLVSRSVKNHPHQLLQKKKVAKICNYQPVIFKNSFISDMHHCKTYKYINFQHNHVSRSVKTVHTNLIAKKVV